MRAPRDAGSNRTTSSGKRTKPKPVKPKSPPPPKSYIKRTQGPSTPAETLERKQASRPVAGPPAPGKTLVRNAEAQTKRKQAEQMLKRRRQRSGLGTSERAKAIQQGQIQRSGIDPSGLWFFRNVVKRPTIGLLEVAGRPAHVVSGAADDIVTGHLGRIPHSALKAIEGKDKRSFSDVLHHAGVHGPVADVLGFAGDVVGDPLTYATFGVGGVARHAGEKAFAKAIREGASEAEAKAAAKTAMEGLPENKGLRVGFRAHVPTVRKGSIKGHTVPALGRKTLKAETSGKATAKLNHKLGFSSAATKVRDTKLVQETGKVFAPDFRPKGVKPEEFEARRKADRLMRAKVHVAEREAHDTQQAFRKAIPKRDVEIVADAIERAPEKLPTEEGTFKRLLAEGNQRIRTRELNEQEKYVYSQMPKASREAVRNSRKEYESNLEELYKAIQRGDEHTAQELARQVDNAEGYLKYNEALDDGIHAHTTTEPGPRVTPALSGHPDVVHEAERRFADMFEEESRTGLHRTDAPIEHYLPHQFPQDVEHEVRKQLEAQERDVPEFARQRRGVKFGFDRQRKLSGSVKEINERMGEEVFSRSVPDLVAHRQLKSGQKVARMRFNQAIADTGTRLGITSKELDNLPDGYGIYKLDVKGNLKAATDQELADFRKGRSIGGSLHLLNVTNTEGALKQFDAIVNRNPRWMTKLIGLWKTGFTILQPSYHIGNFIGDMVMAWEGDAAIAANFPMAWRAVRLHAMWQAYQRSPEAAKSGLKAFELGLNKSDHKLFQILKEAEEHGALQTGFFGSEARMLTGKRGTALRRISEHRENLPRMVTYLTARQEGMTADQAAKWTVKHHIDYGDLTPWERRIRDSAVGIPFYTFFARNTRLQATKLFERPGKAANFQLAREDSADSSGEDKMFDRLLEKYQQAGAPFMLRVNGAHVLFYPRSPVELGLQNLSPSLDSVGSRMNPVVKIPMELWQNRNFFMRQDISSVEDNTKHLPAPKYVAPLEGTPVGDFLGLQRNGEGRLTWSGTADYLAKQIPGGRPATDLAAEGPNRFGQSKAQTALSTAGFKFGPFDRQKIKDRQETKTYFELKERMDDLRKQGLWKDKNGVYTPEYRELKRRMAESQRAYRLKQLGIKQGGNKPRLGPPVG